MCRKNLILAVAMGTVLPAIGILVGLQVSAVLGTILAFPIVSFSKLIGIPFGMWSATTWLAAFAFSVLIWIAMVYVVGKLRKL